MDISSFEPFIKLLPAFFGGAVGGNLLKPIFNTLDLYWFNTFQYRLELKKSKIEWKNEYDLNIYKASILAQDEDLKKFKIEIIENLLDIPQDLVEQPDAQTLALIFEKSKLFLNIEFIREKFAKLIADSANKEKKDSIHPIFVDILTQIQPEDALFLEKLHKFQYIYSIENIGYESPASFNFSMVNKFFSLQSIPIEDENPNLTQTKAVNFEQNFTATCAILEKLGLIEIHNTKKLESKTVKGRGFHIQRNDDIAFNMSILAPTLSKYLSEDFKMEIEKEENNFSYDSSTYILSDFGRLFCSSIFI